MTTQDPISLPASAAMDTAPVQASRPPAASPARVEPAAKKASRRASALPPVPFKCGSPQDLRTWFAEAGKARSNRKRPHQAPPITQAIFCLIASTGALLATSSSGQAEINTAIPVIMESGSRCEAMIADAIARHRIMNESRRTVATTR